MDKQQARDRSDDSVDGDTWILLSYFCDMVTDIKCRDVEGKKGRRAYLQSLTASRRHGKGKEGVPIYTRRAMRMTRHRHSSSSREVV